MSSQDDPVEMAATSSTHQFGDEAEDFVCDMVGSPVVLPVCEANYHVMQPALPTDIRGVGDTSSSHLETTDGENIVDLFGNMEENLPDLCSWIASYDCDQIAAPNLETDIDPTALQYAVDELFPSIGEQEVGGPCLPVTPEVNHAAGQHIILSDRPREVNSAHRQCEKTFQLYSDSRIQSDYEQCEKEFQLYSKTSRTNANHTLTELVTPSTHVSELLHPSYDTVETLCMANTPHILNNKNDTISKCDYLDTSWPDNYNKDPPAPTEEITFDEEGVVHLKTSMQHEGDTCQFNVCPLTSSDLLNDVPETCFDDVWTHEDNQCTMDQLLSAIDEHELEGICLPVIADVPGICSSDVRGQYEHHTQRNTELMDEDDVTQLQSCSSKIKVTANIENDQGLTSSLNIEKTASEMSNKESYRSRLIQRIANRDDDISQKPLERIGLVKREKRVLEVAKEQPGSRHLRVYCRQLNVVDSKRRENLKDNCVTTCCVNVNQSESNNDERPSCSDASSPEEQLFMRQIEQHNEFMNQLKRYKIPTPKAARDAQTNKSPLKIYRPLSHSWRYVGTRKMEDEINSTFPQNTDIDFSTKCSKKVSNLCKRSNLNKKVKSKQKTNDNTRQYTGVSSNTNVAKSANIREHKKLNVKVPQKSKNKGLFNIHKYNTRNIRKTFSKACLANEKHKSTKLPRKTQNRKQEAGEVINKIKSAKMGSVSDTDCHTAELNSCDSEACCSSQLPVENRTTNRQHLITEDNVLLKTKRKYNKKKEDSKQKSGKQLKMRPVPCNKRKKPGSLKVKIEKCKKNNIHVKQNTNQKMLRQTNEAFNVNNNSICDINTTVRSFYYYQRKIYTITSPTRFRYVSKKVNKPILTSKIEVFENNENRSLSGISDCSLNSNNNALDGEEPIAEKDEKECPKQSRIDKDLHLNSKQMFDDGCQKTGDKKASSNENTPRNKKHTTELSKKKSPVKLKSRTETSIENKILNDVKSPVKSKSRTETTPENKRLNEVRATIRKSNEEPRTSPHPSSRRQRSRSAERSLPEEISNPKKIEAKQGKSEPVRRKSNPGCLPPLNGNTKRDISNRTSRFPSFRNVSRLTSLTPGKGDRDKERAREGLWRFVARINSSYGDQLNQGHALDRNKLLTWSESVIRSTQFDAPHTSSDCEHMKTTNNNDANDGSSESLVLPKVNTTRNTTKALIKSMSKSQKNGNIEPNRIHIDSGNTNASRSSLLLNTCCIKQNDDGLCYGSDDQLNEKHANQYIRKRMEAHVLKTDEDLILPSNSNIHTNTDQLSSCSAIMHSTRLNNECIDKNIVRLDKTECNEKAKKVRQDPENSAPGCSNTPNQESNSIERFESSTNISDSMVEITEEGTTQTIVLPSINDQKPYNPKTNVSVSETQSCFDSLNYQSSNYGYFTLPRIETQDEDIIHGNYSQSCPDVSKPHIGNQLESMKLPRIASDDLKQNEESPGNLEVTSEKFEMSLRKRKPSTLDFCNKYSGANYESEVYSSLELEPLENLKQQTDHYFNEFPCRRYPPLLMVSNNKYTPDIEENFLYPGCNENPVATIDRKLFDNDSKLPGDHNLHQASKLHPDSTAILPEPSVDAACTGGQGDSKELVHVNGEICELVGGRMYDHAKDEIHEQRNSEVRTNHREINEVNEATNVAILCDQTNNRICDQIENTSFEQCNIDLCDKANDESCDPATNRISDQTNNGNCKETNNELWEQKNETLDELPNIPWFLLAQPSHENRRWSLSVLPVKSSLSPIPEAAENDDCKHDVHLDDVIFDTSQGQQENHQDEMED